MKFLFLFILGTSGTFAHDINSNKITLIMREKNHVSLAMSMNLLKAMNTIVAPQTKTSDFLLSFSNMNLQKFQKEYDKTKNIISTGLIIYSIDNTKLSIRDWKWPDSKTVQSQFQNYLMEVMTGNHDHAKEPIFEITGELIDPTNKSKLQVQVIKEIQPVMVISYKPTSIWSDTSKSILVEF